MKDLYCPSIWEWYHVPIVSFILWWWDISWFEFLWPNISLEKTSNENQLSLAAGRCTNQQTVGSHSDDDDTNDQFNLNRLPPHRFLSPEPYEQFFKTRFSNHVAHFHLESMEKLWWSFQVKYDNCSFFLFFYLTWAEAKRNDSSVNGVFIQSGAEFSTSTCRMILSKCTFTHIASEIELFQCSVLPIAMF